MHALTMFLPRWLTSLSRAGSDITGHAVVVALGRRAYDFCQGQRRTFGHHCVRDHNWPGPEEPYTFAQDWWASLSLAGPSWAVLYYPSGCCLACPNSHLSFAVCGWIRPLATLYPKPKAWQLPD